MTTREFISTGGSAPDSEVGAPRYCPECGSSVSASGGFCGSCGHKLTKAAAELPSADARVFKGVKCFYCLAPVDGELHTCPDCKGTYHVSCWHENGGCALGTCISASNATQVPPPPAVVTAPASPTPGGAPMWPVGIQTGAQPQVGWDNPPIASFAPSFAPSAATIIVPNRSRGPLIALALCIAAIAVIVLASVQGEDEFDVRGTLDAPDCYSYDLEFVEVRVLDEAGTVLATSTTGANEDSLACTVSWDVTVPKADFYEFQVGTHGGPVYSFDELETNDFDVYQTLSG